MFKDGAGTTYDSAIAKYISVPFGMTAAPTTANPTGTANVPAIGATAAYEPFNFTDAAGLEKKADNTLVGNMMDCGECHVGGGAMQYIPNYAAASPMAGTSNPGARIPLRTAGTTGGILAGFWTTFNSFIDIFGPAGDGASPSYQAKQIDYADSGVLEMDCLVCHLKDYSWENRRDAVRMAKFDASRAYGAGIATLATATTDMSGATIVTNGRNVIYDPAKVAFVNGSTASNGIKLVSAVAQKITAVPDANNCASCHFATVKEKYQVEWKKRGEFWGGSEAHTGIGCMGCHQRKDRTVNGDIDTANVGTSGIANSNNKKLGLCDPAKGADCDYDAQWGAVDKVAFKACNDCHQDTAAATATYPIDLANGEDYGAPKPADIHKAFGLADMIAYNADGTAANHLQIIDCTTCHARKLDASVALYDADGAFRNYTTFPITGGAMVDGTGTDEQGRLAVHDEIAVEREMKDNIALYWKNGKLFVGNLLSSFLIRDANGLFDANNDGRGPGLDPALPTHTARLNEAAGLHALTHDGVVDGTEVATMFTNIQTNLKPMIGSGSLETIVPKISIMGVPFKVSHNIAPKISAWGVKGCKECHSSTSKFMSSFIDISPKTDFSWNAGQFANIQKVNGSTQPSDIHAQVVEKKGVRSVAVNYANNSNTDLSTGFRDVQKAELLYEATFTKRDSTYKSTITGTSRPVPGAANSPWYNAGASVPGTTVTAGWTMKIEAAPEGSAATVSPTAVRTFSVTSGTLTSVDALITHMGAAFTTDLPEFTIAGIDTNADLVNDAIEITAKAGFQVRLSNQTDVGPFGLTGALWIADPITRNNAYTGDADLVLTGRSDYLNYFHGIGAAPAAGFTINGAATDACGTLATPCAAPTAALITFAAPAGAATTTYSWTFSDDTSKNTTGATATRTINTVKSFTVTLLAKNTTTGDVTTTKKIVKTAAIASAALTGVDTTATGDTTVSLTGLPTHSKLYVKWGDGTEQYVTSSAAAIDLTHKYLKTGTMNVAINIINGTTLVAKKTCAITVKPVITASAVVNGTLTPEDVTQILSGANQTYTITPTAAPYAGYAIANVLVNGASVGPVASYTFTGLTAPSSTISATFKPTINAVQTANGSIAPAGVTPVTSGGSQYYTITPANGYHVESVTVNGQPAAVATSYNFTNVTEPQQITAIFAAN
ncbi:MAG: PKD domain-containing protein [Geobacteraceae bacterium]|nr:PKD domain-containing protein [Geobacteraceae bacterium]